jgi:hypothetical protein
MERHVGTLFAFIALSCCVFVWHATNFRSSEFEKSEFEKFRLASKFENEKFMGRLSVFEKFIRASEERLSEFEKFNASIQRKDALRERIPPDSMVPGGRWGQSPDIASCFVASDMDRAAREVVSKSKSGPREFFKGLEVNVTYTFDEFIRNKTSGMRIKLEPLSGQLSEKEAECVWDRDCDCCEEENLPLAKTLGVARTLKTCPWITFDDATQLPLYPRGPGHNEQEIMCAIGRMTASTLRGRTQMHLFQGNLLGAAVGGDWSSDSDIDVINHGFSNYTEFMWGFDRWLSQEPFFWEFTNNVREISEFTGNQDVQP